MVFTQVPDASKGDLEKAISAASTAFRSWKKTSFTERAACMKKFVEGLKSRQQEFAKALTLEQGKPLGAAAGDWQREEGERVPPAQDQVSGEGAREHG